MTKHRDTCPDPACRGWVEELIQKCLDREITVEENITLQLHLSQCPDCSTLYNELVSFEQAIVSLVEFTPNHGFNNRVLQQVKARTQVWKKVATVLGGTWIATAIAFLLSPISSDIFHRVLFSSPSIARLADKVYFIGSTLTKVFTPIAKNQFNPFVCIAGLVLGFGMFFLFGKFLKKKELICTA